jgi:hypothetical protein
MPRASLPLLFTQLPRETVRKGFEQRSNCEFDRYTEHEIGQEGASRQPVGLRHQHVRDFSDSLRSWTLAICERKG